MATTKKRAEPFYGGTCYACAAPATGLRDRRPEGGFLEPACDRHRDPRVTCFDACFYCSAPARRGSVVIDGEFAHASCHREAAR